MNNFWVGVGTVDEGSVDFGEPVAFKKFHGWPIIPRVGEWFEADDGNCVPVIEIWHRNIDGVPATILYCDKQPLDGDIPELIKNRGWSKLPSPTFVL